HDSARFGLGARTASTYVVDKLAFWRDERWQIAVEDGVDDIALALVADAWSRTGRVRVVAASDSGSVRLRSGLKLATAVADGDARSFALDAALEPVPHLDRTLLRLAERFGEARAERLMQEIE